MKKKDRYNYKKITMTLDMDEDDDKEIMAWLERNKSKRNNFSVQLRSAIKRLIEEQK